MHYLSQETSSFVLDVTLSKDSLKRTKRLESVKYPFDLDTSLRWFQFFVSSFKTCAC